MIDFRGGTIFSTYGVEFEKVKFYKQVLRRPVHSLTKTLFLLLISISVHIFDYDYKILIIIQLWYIQILYLLKLYNKW